MSDAERPGRERLDWGEGEGSEPSGPTEPAAEPDDAENGPDSDAIDDADGEDGDGELCVIEDPTCEACQ